MQLSYSSKVCNVAVNDMPRGWMNDNDLNKRIYRVWYSMIQRCYSGYERYKAYEKCSVAPEWLYLSNFVSDVEKIPGYIQWKESTVTKEYALDKDMIRPGNTEYRLGLVQFVSNSANVSFKKNIDPTQGHRVLSKKQKSITLFKDQTQRINKVLDNPRAFQHFIRKAVDLALEEAERREVMKK